MHNKLKLISRKNGRAGTAPTSTQRNSARTMLTVAVILAGGLVAACGGQQQAGDGGSEAAAVGAEQNAVARLTDNTGAHDIDGIRLIVKHIPDAPFTHAGIYIRGGAMTWDDALLGVEEFALNVATGAGPASMTKAEYSALLDRTGTELSASSGYDAATAHVDSLAANFDRMFALLVETLREPALPESEIGLVREGTMSAIRTMFDDPDSAARHTARLNAFADHPYGKVPFGTEETVSGFTAAQLRAALESLLVRERLLVVIVGGTSEAEARRLVSEHLSDLPSDPDWYNNADGSDARTMAPLPESSSDVRFMDRGGLPTNYVLGYYPAPNGTHADYPALRLAIEVLSDRLFEEVRTKRNLSYAVSSRLAFRNANVGTVYVTATDPPTTMGVIFDTIQNMVDEPVPDSDLRDQLEGYLTRYYMRQQSMGAQVGTLADWELNGGGYENADAFIDAMRAVTPEDVSRVVDTWVRNIQYGVVRGDSTVQDSAFTGR